jgi:hypothetical protein
MKKISNKIDAKRSEFSTAVIFFATTLTVFQLMAFTGNTGFIFFLPLMLPIISFNCIMEWNFDFKNATFAEKRKMAEALNKDVA